MSLVGTRDGVPRNRTIEGDELSPVPNREREKIDIGDLPGSVNPARVRDLRVEQTDVVRPEPV